MINGTLVPFIELGVGFNPELTGRENVYLNGALLGFSRDQVDAMYDDIVEFAELGEFMDQKLKNYSSGMQVRLAFSVAIKARGDILVLDEVLAVGDEAFQKKCDRFFKQVKTDPSKTVILVTHSMDAVKKYCNKAILIKDGELLPLVTHIMSQISIRSRMHMNSTITRQRTTRAKELRYPNGLNQRVPVLRITPVSLNRRWGISLCFDVEYEYAISDRQGYLGLILQDARRGGQIYDVDTQSEYFGLPIEKGTIKSGFPFQWSNSITGSSAFSPPSVLSQRNQNGQITSLSPTMISAAILQCAMIETAKTVSSVTAR